MTDIRIAIEVDGHITNYLHFVATFRRTQDGPDNWDWGLVAATCTRIEVHPYKMSHEWIDMAEHYEGDGADYTCWLRDWIKTQRSNPAVYTVAGNIRSPTTNDLYELLDRQWDTDNERDPASEADRMLDRLDALHLRLTGKTTV